MDSRLLNRLRFLLERWIQGGAGNQLLLTAALIGLIAVVAGTLAWALTGTFEDYGEAVWWSFLRLSDPGYLGDDEGAFLRFISTVITVMGYVLFLGSLIAIMTQWLNGTIRRLELGLSPIAVSGHTLILGWTNRTPNLLRELVEADTVEDRGAARRRIVILADDVSPVLRNELREALGADYDRWRIILRSGSALRVEHLRRVDFGRAETIIIPGSDYSLGGHEASDARVFKTLLTIAHHLDAHDRTTPLPHVIAEILDTSRLLTIRSAYHGPVETIASDAFVSRIIAQNLRHPGLASVYTELLSHSSGNELYSGNFPELTGETFGHLSERFVESVLLGIVRYDNGHARAVFNPDPGFVLEAGDACIGIARSPQAFVPDDDRHALSTEPLAPPTPRRPGTPEPARILVLGWNHRFYQLIEELSGFGDPLCVDVLSPIPPAERAPSREIADDALVRVNHLVGDYTEETVVQALDLEAYRNILFLGNNWMASGEETDAQTLLGYALVESLLRDTKTKTPILVELMNQQSAPLLPKRAEALVSPVIVSHLLAHVAVRPELNAVMTELFAPFGSEIRFETAGALGLTGRTMRFRDLRRYATSTGRICLGVRTLQNGTLLNPPRDRQWTLAAGDQLVLLSSSGAPNLE